MNEQTIVGRATVEDAKGIQDGGKAGLSLAALFLSLPWCCITPGVLAMLGFFGAAGSSRLVLNEVMVPFFIVSLLFLGRAHYMIHVKKRGSGISRAAVWIFTIAALALWAFRFGLIAI